MISNRGIIYAPVCFSVTFYAHCLSNQMKGVSNMKINITIVLLTIILGLSGCYTIVNQPSVLPMELQGSTQETYDNSSPEVINNYFLYDGMYYNRPFYADPRNMRYDRFSNSYYYDPYYYNYNNYYNDTRWYYNNNQHYNSGHFNGIRSGGSSGSSQSGTVNTETTQRAKNPRNKNTATAPNINTPATVVAPSSSSSSSGSVKKSSPSSSSSDKSTSSDKTTKQRTKKRKR